MENEALEDGLRSAIDAYKEKVKESRIARDDAIRRASALGMRQVDIVRVTGYNRETIRQIVKAGKDKEPKPPTA